VTDSATMRERFAAQSVIEKLLQVQSTLPPRSSVARLLGLSPLGPESQPWYAGAKGEIVVGSLLAQLPPEWTVFHALPVGTKGSDIDHLVVGPGGVFTINTKRHSGKNIWVAGRTVMVAGQKVPYMRNAEFEAARVTRLMRERMPLLPPAQPVIAFVDPRQITIREKPAQVKVVDARHLRRWLTKLAVVLDESELDLLVDYLDDPATWSLAPSALSGDELDRFAALDAEVRSARIRRACWSVIVGVALVVASIAVLPLLIQMLLARA
jgi:hypothetical protein